MSSKTQSKILKHFFDLISDGHEHKAAILLVRQEWGICERTLYNYLGRGKDFARNAVERKRKK